MYRRYFKRPLDLIISGIALICLSPVLLIVTVWLHFANEGAGAFFVQKRVGKDNRVFKLYKFKSMTDERDNMGRLKSDAERLTPIGSIVRKTSLDEIPQLINVLIGDMSLIGPRPLTLGYYHVFNEEQLRRHVVRPGITGWAQVHGRAFCKLSDKFRYDLWYVDNCTAHTDMKIIAKTIIGVLKKKDIGSGKDVMQQIDDLGMDKMIEEYYKTHAREE